jgi:hypothetical protein
MPGSAHRDAGGIPDEGRDIAKPLASRESS